VTESALVERLRQERATAIVRCDDQEVAASAMEAAVRGGFSIVEFTLTVPGVFELVQEFSSREGLIVGAGTVLRPQDAEAAVEAGARFLVSPVVDEAVIGRALDLGVDVMPGTHTPTEMMRAHAAGAALLKLFPALAGGPSWLRALLGPLPFLRVVPTNGVDESNVVEWLESGAFAAAFAATLFTPEDLLAADYSAIENRARTILERIGTIS
jgi:2-dehydro-3-deoxyphosphogluconate aldolase/(4S)-4-hydroxy-2-oxoglutarate aldolase